MATVTTVFLDQGRQACLVKRLLNNDKLQLWLGLAFTVLLPTLVSQERLVLVKSERTHFQAAAASSISLGDW
ncbi:hypothetical protein [Halomonas sp. M4R1S46]|uniref:hypothetical protein n=1 Tax=Halomonas sp. M4R1S46 TaxID=2982692 RepID=UPI0021E491F8|nr:hypothetical protein [Halomonas sp. M4R1S46]UYG06329.1 hypothetical protein OCT48_11875 [Halomonas sp. M4R1S46]